MNFRKRIIGAAAFLCAVPAVISGAVLIGGRSAGEAVPAALITDLSEPPVIILDAGHAISSKPQSATDLFSPFSS